MTPDSLAGFATFQEIGCATCHIPELLTESRNLPLRYPEIHEDPDAYVFYDIDLSKPPAKFRKSGSGLVVPLFADLKRHDMGEGLAEGFALASDARNREFTTARLWGVADTAPYLHDGRATTLTDAILLHGGEAQSAREAFEGLSTLGRVQVLTFLRTLRTPKPNSVDASHNASAASESPDSPFDGPAPPQSLSSR
jgi:CxxC motif-containing protein (DUF1111 family)